MGFVILSLVALFVLYKNAVVTPGFDRRSLTHWTAFGFGSGFLPWSPGTWGTLASALLYWGFVQVLDVYFSFLSWNWEDQTRLDLLLVALVAVPGFAICRTASQAVYSETGSHDHGSIVWDEWAGFMVTMLFMSPHLGSIVIGFVLFRFFDIVKPWPIRLIDKSKTMDHGRSIMLDDIVAGLMAGGTYWLIWWLYH